MSKYTRMEGFFREQKKPTKHSQSAFCRTKTYPWYDSEICATRYFSLNIWMPKYDPRNNYKNRRPGIKLSLSLGPNNEFTIHMNHDDAANDLKTLFRDLSDTIDDLSTQIEHVHVRESNEFYQEIERKKNIEHKRQQTFISIKESFINVKSRK